MTDDDTEHAGKVT